MLVELLNSSKVHGKLADTVKDGALCDIHPHAAFLTEHDLRHVVVSWAHGASLGIVWWLLPSKWQGQLSLAGWWAETGAWVPRDWALRPSYDTRVAIINALYACGENVQKLMPVLLTEAIRRDRRATRLRLSNPAHLRLQVACFPALYHRRSPLQALERMPGRLGWPLLSISEA